MERLARELIIVQGSCCSSDICSLAQLQFRGCQFDVLRRYHSSSRAARFYNPLIPMKTSANSNPLVSINALNVRDSQQSTSNGLYIPIQEKKTEHFGIPRRDLTSGMSVQYLGELPKLLRHSQTEVSSNSDSVAEKQRQLEVLAGWRLGRLLVDKVYRQTVVIRSYEVGAEKTTSIDTLISLLQETALNHMSLLGITGDGFGTTVEMIRKRLIWVLARLHVEVESYPCWAEVVDIDTWLGPAGKNSVRRDWVLRGNRMGRIIGRATSTWVMMHQDTRKLSKIPDEASKEVGQFFFEKHAFDEANVEKIVKLDGSAQSIRSKLTSSRKDLDVNQHVNNVKYVDWAMESIPEPTFQTHNLRSLTLEYRRECNKDDVVESLCNIERCSGSCSSWASSNTQSRGQSQSESQPKSPSPCSSGMAIHNGESFSGSQQQEQEQEQSDEHDLQYTHLLRMQKSGDEIVRGRSVWCSRKSQSLSQLY